MAGAYKGLTIRIGADTAKLTAALRSANSNIYKTQTELNKLTKALKIDPGNMKGIDQMMGRISEQAANTAHEIDVLQKGIDALGNKQLFGADGKLIDGSSVRELADGTEDVIRKANESKDAWTRTNAELERMYGTLNRISDRNVNDLFKNANGNTIMKDLTEEVEKLVSEHKMSREEADLYLKSVEQLKNRWVETKAAMDNYASAADLKKLDDDLVAQEANLKKIGQDFADLASKSDVSRAIQPLKEQLQLVSRASDTAADRFKRLNEASKLNPNSMGTMIERARSLGEATRAANEKAKSLKDQLEAYRAEGIDKIAAGTKDAALAFEQAKDEVARLKTELEQTKTEFGENSDEANRLRSALDDALRNLDTTAAVNEYRELQVQLRETQAESKSMKAALVEDLGGVGAAAVQAAVEVGNLVERAGSKIVESSTEIDAAYRNMRKTVNGTEEQYQALYDAAMEYSQTHVTSADMMLEMEALAGQVGIAADQLENFAQVAANLDVATDIDAEDIALKMGQIVNVMSDLTAENVQGFADALVDLGNNMPAQESSIMQIAQRLSSIGDVAGFTTPEILGWAAAIASTGQRSEAAATGISNTITTIQTAVSAGGDDLEAFAEAIGMSADVLKERWGEDASGVLRDFIGRIQELGPDAIAELDKLGISGIRQTQTLLSLASTADNVDEAIERSQGAWDRFAAGNPIDGIGEAAQEAGRKAEGFSGSMSKMQNSAQVLAATLGENLAPYIDDAAGLMQGLTDIINSMDDSTKDAIVKFGVMTVAFSTAYPIVSALGGSFLNLFGSVRRLAMGGFAKVAVGFGDVVSGARNAATVLGWFVESPVETAAVLKDMGGAATTAGSLLGLIATPAGVAATALTGVGLAIGAAYIQKFVKAEEHARRMDTALRGMHDNAEDVSRALWNGRSDIDDYAESIGNVANKSKDAASQVGDLLEAVEEHNKRNAETRDTAETTIGMLSRYKEVIDEAMGAEDKSAVNVGLLQWALDGLGEVTGEAYDAIDLLNGKYADEEESALRTKDAIDKLIETKKREAKMDALKSMYTDALETQMQAQQAYDKANDYFKKYVDDWVKIKAEQGVSREDALEKLYADDGYKQVRQNLADAAQLLHGTTEEVDRYEASMNGLAAEMYTVADASDHVRENMMRDNDVINGILTTAWDGQDRFAELAKSIEDAGVSADDFAGMMDKSGGAMAAMAQASGGDIQTLVDMVVAYNELPVEIKELGVTYDDDALVTADGDRIVWNETEWVWQETGVTVDTSSLPKSKENIDKTKSAEDRLKDKDSKVKVSGNATDGSGAKAIDNTKTSEDKLYNKSVEVKATGNVVTGVAASAVSWLNTVIGQMKSKTIDVTTRNKTVNVPAGAGTSATGAYVPYNKIPKHAAGIFTRPTLTNIGWVGEDGAELYSGNSLVPLTNRKYSMPYINDISDAVAKKMGGAGSTTTITLNVSCDGGPEETANAIVRALRANRF